MNNTILFFTSIYFNYSLIELIITCLSITLLLLVISPSILILLDYDLLFIPGCIVYSIGYQWAWKLNIHLVPTGSTCIDEYLIPIGYIVSKYLLLINTASIIIPLYSIIRWFLLSYDVIHSIGFYSFGIKLDAIPARINITTSLRAIIKGEYRGFCFELCGQGHSLMILGSYFGIDIYNGINLFYYSD